MSGIGDQGMMPDKVRPQRADDDTLDERVAAPPDAGERDPDSGQEDGREGDVPGGGDDGTA